MTREFNLAKWYRNLCAEGGGMKFNRNPHMRAGMTREEIKQIGIAAGISEHAFGLGTEQAWQQVERFVALVAAAEREACIRICERHATGFLDGEELSDWKSGYGDGAGACFEVIRARGEE